MAEEEDDAQKTEEPTAKKLQRAKSRGQTATSQEVKNWGLLVATTLAFTFLAPGAAEDIAILTSGLFENAHQIVFDYENLIDYLVEKFWRILLVLSPFLGLLVLAAIGVSAAQTGFIWAPSKIKPDLGKISVLKGIKRMVSLRSVVELLKGALKLIVIAVLSIMLAIPFLQDIRLMPAMDFSEVLDRIFLLIIILLLGAVVVMTIVAVIDFIYQRYAFIKQMRMTKQEVKDEHKQSEGDPQVKARIRQLRAERSRQRMMAAVPDADVVVTNPTHFAVALRYKMEEMTAPVVVAKGQDFIALKIREVAEENEVPIYENPPLARTLYAAVEIDQEIPTEHYQAVAEVIGYVMRLRGEGIGNRRSADSDNSTRP